MITLSKLLCWLSRLIKCWCHLCKTLDGPFVNSPSSFNSLLLEVCTIYDQHYLLQTSNAFPMCSYIFNSFLCLSIASHTQNPILSSFSLSTAFLILHCACLIAFHALANLEPSILSWAAFFASIKGVNFSTLSSNHSGCLFFPQSTDILAAYPIEQYKYPGNYLHYALIRPIYIWTTK